MRGCAVPRAPGGCAPKKIAPFPAPLSGRVVPFSATAAEPLWSGAPFPAPLAERGLRVGGSCGRARATRTRGAGAHLTHLRGAGNGAAGHVRPADEIPARATHPQGRGELRGRVQRGRRPGGQFLFRERVMPATTAVVSSQPAAISA
ncbi:hypothetical protein GCM10010372_53530 [Streptomyces tauricus]|nr:hypothetical protein GCM10010372_53530 [Streptomyces tauricus]